MPPAVNAEIFVAAFFGGWEILLILALAITLYGAKRLPELARGLGDGIRGFWEAADEVTRELNANGYDAGKSIGGIYGKPAAQAIAHDNRVAEFYEVNDGNGPGHRSAIRIWKFLARSVFRAVRWLLRIRVG